MNVFLSRGFGEERDLITVLIFQKLSDGDCYIFLRHVYKGALDSNSDPLNSRAYLSLQEKLAPFWP